MWWILPDGFFRIFVRDNCLKFQKASFFLICSFCSSYSLIEIWISWYYINPIFMFMKLEKLGIQDFWNFIIFIKLFSNFNKVYIFRALLGSKQNWVWSTEKSYICPFLITSNFVTIAFLHHSLLFITADESTFTHHFCLESIVHIRFYF